MSEGAAAVVEGFWRAWSRRDKVGTMAFLATDIRYAMYIPQETVPFGGETQGRAAMSDRLQTILDAFDTLRFEGSITSVHGKTVRGQAAFAFRHKITGEVLEGVMRHVAVVEDGLIYDMAEYHDVERVKAFMRLVAHTAAR